LNANPAPAAKALVASPDQKLVDLAAQLMERLPAQLVAQKRCNELWDEFEARKPERSDVLRYRISDDVGWDRPSDNERRLWCDPFNIEALRGVRQYDWSLLERNEAEFFALPEADQLRHLGAPKPHVQHLFSKTPSARKQNRINKLIAALDEYTAACDALKVELGMAEADDVLEKLWDPIGEIVEHMKAIEPTTVQGLQAKAKMLLLWYWQDDDDTDDQDPIAVEIVKALAGVQLAA
jgi:hypothetical protein